ncbi:hypothetical protein [Novosphingobium soli]
MKMRMRPHLVSSVALHTGMLRRSKILSQNADAIEITGAQLRRCNLIDGD